MINRTASDQVTALANAALGYGLCLLLGLAVPTAAVVAGVIYAGLAGTFVAYRRHLAGLQGRPVFIHSLEDDVAPYGERRAA